MTRLLYILLIPLLLAASAFGSDYYVATTGNDSAVGSEVAPWQTIARVLPDYSGEGTAVTQGDTVIFAAGSYGQFYYSEAGGTGRTGYITYQGADSGNRPVFTNLNIRRTKDAYMKFDNIEFRPTAITGQLSAVLIEGWTGSNETTSYVQIINSYVNSQPGDTGDHAYAGINVNYSENITVDNCEIEKNGYGFLASNVDGITVSDCNIHLSYLDTVHLVDVCDVVIEDSLIHHVQWRTQSGATHRDAIQIYANVGEICDNVTIRRNKIYECEAQATNIVSTNDNQLTNFTWENNLFYGRFAAAPGYNMAEPYQTGTVTVTNGSKTVTGTMTGWDSSWEGLFYLRTENSTTAMAIESFDDATGITLSSNWTGDSGSDLRYAIYVTYNLFNVEGTNLRVINNTFATRLSGQGIMANQVFNLTMYNNICAGTSYSFDWIDKPVTWLVDPESMSGFNNNIFGDYNPTGWALDDLSTAGDGLATANTELGQNGEDAAVGFVDADNYDFRLALGSTAIDRGDSVYAPIFDIQGNIRSTSPEAGAYEYGAEIRYLLARILK